MNVGLSRNPVAAVVVFAVVCVPAALFGCRQNKDRFSIS